MLKLVNKVKNSINFLFRTKIINKNYKQKLQNHNMSVISSNCNGAFMLNDLGEKFNSPFVNLYLLPDDFLKYLENIAFYKKAVLSFPKDEQKEKYPIGVLGDIKIHFMHYHSQQEAKNKWEERTERINMDNLFVLMTDRDGCTYEHLKRFDNLPYKNKIIFTHKKYPDIKSSYYIKGFENEKEVGVLSEYKGVFGKRYYDDFDFVSWFNNE